MKKIAVVLSGCGVYDGTEIHEACAALLALRRAGAEIVACAPAGPQLHVVDHLRGVPTTGEVRDILVESARLVRGGIRPLVGLAASEVDGVLLPGGFGAAKNLCTFATEGAACRVHPEVETFLREARDQGRPIAAMCIAPVILARVFGGGGKPRVTIGDDAATAALIEAMGASHEVCAPTGIVVDDEAGLLTTPAYMLATDLPEVFEGAEALVKKLLTMCP
ncbi:MAG: isoprenoid biosynthesis glyoxalase ElbB [bacterium]|nr:isoprenoid biosynthesis glyoxalase ElbB [bacterium]